MKSGFIQLACHNHLMLCETQVTISFDSISRASSWKPIKLRSTLNKHSRNSILFISLVVCLLTLMDTDVLKWERSCRKKYIRILFWYLRRCFWFWSSDMIWRAKFISYSIGRMWKFDLLVFDRRLSVCSMYIFQTSLLINKLTIRNSHSPKISTMFIIVFYPEA